MARFPFLRRAFRLDAGPSRARSDADLAVEIEFHLASRRDELIAQGMVPEKADARAASEFGDFTSIRAACASIDRRHHQEVRMKEFLASIHNDVRFACRLLWRSPAFALTAIATLALGIGATTAICSIADTVLLHTLPFDHPERIVHIGERPASKPGPGGTTSDENFEDWSRLAHSFESMAIVSDPTLTITGLGDPEQLTVPLVSAGVFHVLGITPILGRAVVPSDNTPQAPPITILSYDAWRTRFGGDPAVIGRVHSVNGLSATIVGVLPPGLSLPKQLQGELWGNHGNDGSGRSGRSKNVIARLKPGVTLEQAQAEMTTIAAHLAESYPDDDRGSAVTVDRVSDLMVAPIRRPLELLLGASGLLLLIACANISSLLVAQGMARAREIAVRAALGASRRRAIRQLATESLVLAALGGAGGVLLSIVAVRALADLAPAPLKARAITWDPRILTIALALTLVVGLVVGLFPALRVARADLHAALRNGARGSRGGSTRSRSVLAVTQLALALTLLVGCGLLLDSFVHVMGIAPGIRPDHLLTLSINAGAQKYAGVASTGLFNEVEERVRGLPGVTAASVTSLTPFSGRFDRIAIRQIAGQPATTGGASPRADRYIVSPSYFTTMGISLQRGQPLTSDDRYDAPLVCVVDEIFARRAFGNANPIGQRLQIPLRDSMATVIGVVGHVKTYGLDQESPGQIYLSDQQYPWQQMNLMVRTTEDPLAPVAALRSIIHGMDPNLPVAEINTMEGHMSDLLEQRRFTLLLMVGFGATAALLSAIGLYGLVSHGILQRRQEIGIRLALGASEQSVVLVVARQGLILAAIGLGIGVVLALTLGHLLASLLFGVAPHDPLVLTGAAGLVAAIALLASFIPARLAARVDVASALRP